MIWLRRISSLGLVLLLTVGVGCTSTDTPTAPAAPSQDQVSPEFGIIGDLTDGLTSSVDRLTTPVIGTVISATDLLTCSEQPYRKTTETIGPDGGLIKVGSHQLFIPRGALSAPVKITAEQMRGSTNSVRFSPEGLKFKSPAVLTMSYDNCAINLLQKKIVYTDENLSILEQLFSFDYAQYDYVSAPISHFSRYAVAW